MHASTSRPLLPGCAPPLHTHRSAHGSPGVSNAWPVHTLAHSEPYNQLVR
eukprot:COSAG01_NODE_911_length_12783_cov_145.960817_9_plen_50_part_00